MPESQLLHEWLRRAAAATPDATAILEEELAPGIWQRLAGGAWNSGKNIRTVQVGALEARISETLPGASASSGESALSPLAPMPGLVRQVLIKKGDQVKKGQALAVLEAMKLQLTLSAGADATDDKVLVTVGQLVAEGAELVKLIAKKS